MNRKAYDDADGEYGALGEVAVRNYITRSGYRSISHPNGTYGPDVEYESGTERFYVDVERAHESRWKGDSWLPFGTIHVLARRPIRSEILVVTLSSDMTKAYVSFPDDLLKVEPVPMDNRFVKGELIRDHEIMRCLPLDLGVPISGTLARMNVDRVRRLAESGIIGQAVRALRGKYPYPFGPPYGMSHEEWAELELLVERRSGITSYVGRDPSRPASRQVSLFPARAT